MLKPNSSVTVFGDEASKEGIKLHGVISRGLDRSNEIAYQQGVNGNGVKWMKMEIEQKVWGE